MALRRALEQRGIVLRAIAAIGLLGGTLGAACWADREILPDADVVAPGVRVSGVEVERGSHPRAVAEDAARRLLEKRLTVRYEGEDIAEASLADLGAEVDVAALASAIGRAGHDEDLFARIDSALEATRGHVDVPVRMTLPVEPLATRLDRFKEEHDRAPLPAKIDIATAEATAHVSGRYLDPYVAVRAIERAISANERAVDIAPFEIEPRASTSAVALIDVTQIVSKYETRFGYLGGQNRGQNVARAASQMDGVVLMPGDVVSFNANVGPRTLENGFATAPEIYKGELREGVGGGTCQVAGTLHAAAFFGGVDIVERSNHSRPSGYIPIGLDATVVYPVVDLRLRNPYDFPIVIHAVIDKGTLRFELRGSAHPATVELATDTVGVAPFKRKIEEVAWLPAGKVHLKQKGIRGYSIRKTRKIHLDGGKDRVEVTTDVYPPTFEIYEVPPGTDVATALPPPPEEAAAAATATQG